VGHKGRELRVIGDGTDDGQVVASTAIHVVTIDVQTFGQALIRSES
jgi:hypothetical protein